MSNNNQDGFDPFKELSSVFIHNQRNFTAKNNDLMNRTKNFANKLQTVLDQLNNNPFEANLNLYLNIEEESRLIVMVAKELEFHRDNILKSVDLLKESNKVKLNK